MSKFTDYENKASTQYDATRIAVGIETLEGMIRHHSKTAWADIKMLSLGCGTGNYEAILLENGIGHITMTDGSHKMLEQSKAKLAHLPDKTEYRHVVLPDVSAYSEAQYDVVINTMVLHHIVQLNPDTQTVTDWSPIEKTFCEAQRVLKPGGIFMLNWASREQVKALWYAHLVPKGMERVCQRYTSFEHIMNMLEAAGLEFVCKVNLVDPIQGPIYHENSKFVQTDNFWFTDSVLSGQEAQPEIPAAKENVARMLADGSFDDWAKSKNGVPVLAQGFMWCLRK